MRGQFLCLVAFTLLTFSSMPSTAQAADELGLSWDGHTWAEQLSEPVFDPAALWVPGDVGAKTFHVRNQAESGAILTIAVNTRDDDDLLRNEDIKLSARVGTEDWVDLKQTEQNFRLSNDELPAGESRKIEVKADFDFASPNRSQQKQLALNFRVTLSDAQASPDDHEGPGDDDESTGPGDTGGVDDEANGPLANAGAPAVGWVIVAGGVAIGAGLRLITRRKRKETEHDAAH